MTKLRSKHQKKIDGKANSVLPKKTAEFIEVVDWLKITKSKNFHIINNSFGEINLYNLSLKTAKSLIDRGVLFLKLKTIETKLIDTKK